MSGWVSFTIFVAWVLVGLGARKIDEMEFEKRPTPLWVLLIDYGGWTFGVLALIWVSHFFGASTEVRWSATAIVLTGNVVWLFLIHRNRENYWREELARRKAARDAPPPEPPKPVTTDDKIQELLKANKR